MSQTSKTADRSEKLVEISFFRSNALSYQLILFSVLAEMIYVIALLGQVEINVLVGVITMINIVMLFLLFTIAIKVNVYSMYWTRIGFATTAYLVLRAVVLLPMVVKPLGSYGLIYGGTAVTILLLLAGCIISQRKIVLRENAKKGGRG